MADGQSSLDMDAVRDLKQIMGDEFQALLDTFRADSQLRIQAIREAVAGGDPDEIRRAAHSFKGSAGNMGASGLSELCRSMEDRGFNGVTDGCDVLLADIETEYRQVQSLLDSLL